MPTFDDGVYDAALDTIALCDVIHATTALPADHAGIAVVTVGNYPVTAGDGNGDWTIADGDTSGRKITLGAQSGNNGTATGAANYIAGTDGTTRHFAVDGDGDTVNSGSPWTLGAVDVVEFGDAVNE